jgi:cell division septum initiation protein DivIVA
MAEAVESVEFSTAFHGYEPQQVRAFLSDFASGLRALERDLPVRLPAEAEHAAEASTQNDLTEEMAEVMSAATQEIRALRDRAAQAAEEQIQRAGEEASTIVSEAERQAAARTATAARDAEERVETADQRLADAEAVLQQAEVDAALARDEAEQLGRKAVAEAEQQAAAVREEAEQQARETLAAAERQGMELAKEAQRIAENALEDAERREQEMSTRLLERQEQLQVIDLELRAMSEMAADLLSVSEFLADRVVRLRQKANGLSGATDASGKETGAVEPGGLELEAGRGGDDENGQGVSEDFNDHGALESTMVEASDG